MLETDEARLPGRRRALQLVITTTLGLLTGGLAALLGGFVLNPGRAARRERWVKAAALADLEPGAPQATVISVVRAQGWYRNRSREVVYLTWDGADAVRAVSATCTHLGCLVKWDAKAKQFDCPCHGGVFNEKGEVIAGPPPLPLGTLQTRMEPSDAGPTVLVRV